jgi:hypothetical protein
MDMTEFDREVDAIAGAIKIRARGSYMKLAEPIEEYTQDIQAIRVYLPELMKNINSTRQSNEEPRLRIWYDQREKTGEREFELFFLGTERDRHIEEISYSHSNPHGWTTWGEIVLSPDEMVKLAANVMAILVKHGNLHHDIKPLSGVDLFKELDRKTKEREKTE